MNENGWRGDQFFSSLKKLFLPEHPMTIYFSSVVRNKEDTVLMICLE